MNKDNKRAAQQRRAVERAKQARANTAKKVLPWIVVLAIFAGLIGFFIWQAWHEDESASDTEVQTSQSSDDSSAGSSGSTSNLNTTVGTEVKEGDTVNIDYAGKLDGVAFYGGTGNYDLTLGSGQFIPGFEDQVIGHKVGETFDVNVTFPEGYSTSYVMKEDGSADYDQPMELSGAAGTFTVTINGVQE